LEPYQFPSASVPMKKKSNKRTAYRVAPPFGFEEKITGNQEGKRQGEWIKRAADWGRTRLRREKLDTHAIPSREKGNARMPATRGRRRIYPSALKFAEEDRMFPI